MVVTTLRDSKRAEQDRFQAYQKGISLSQLKDSFEFSAFGVPF